MVELKLFIFQKDVIDLWDGKEVHGYVTGDKIVHVEIQVPISWIVSYEKKVMKNPFYILKKPSIMNADA